MTSLAACGDEDGTAGDDAAAEAPAERPENWPEIASDEVIVAGFGGLTYDVRREINFAPFTEISGAEVVDVPWDFGRFVAMLGEPDPEWDMIDFDGFSLIGLLEGGNELEPLADWVRRADLVDEEYQDYAGGGYAYSVVMGWSTDLEEEPKDWADFFDTERFPGQRAFPRSIYAGTVEIALLADGVPKDELYPLDFDRAFAKLDSIRGDLIFYDSYAQGQQYMTQGSATMIATANSRMQQLQDDGVPVDYAWQDAILYPWSAFTMPSNPPNADAANALIDFLNTPEQQAAVARQLGLGPVVSDAFSLLSDEELERTPNSPQNVEVATVVDSQSLADADAEYVERFYGWVGE